MWKISVFGCFLLIVTIVKNASGLEFPAGIEKCKYGDGQCIIDQTNKAFEIYPHGNNILSLPDLNPLIFNSVDITQDSSKSVNLNLKMKDIRVEDFNTLRFFNTTPVKTDDWNNTVITHWAASPKMHINSKYTINGKILVLPIEGSGDMHMVMTNPRYAIKLKISTHKKDDGKIYLNVDKLKIKTEAESMTIQMENLFNGDKTLGDNLNKVMNENWNVIWDEVEPSVDRAFADTMINGMNSFFKAHPIEDIFIIEK